MAILNIRNLSDHVHRKLRLRAARAGHSMEAEARAILTAVCADEDECSPGDLRNFVDSLYHGDRPANAVAELISDRRREGRE